MRLAGTLSAKGELVRLVDFDLQDKLLSLKLGNYHTAGVADLLASLKVPPEEFLAPLSGTTIEFAPAGMCTLADIPTEASDNLAQLLSPPKNGTLIVEAGFDSPVQVLLEHVEAVICVAAADKPWTPHQQKVLLEIKEARKPIWGLFQGGSGIFPFE